MTAAALPGLARRLEEACLNGWPALRQLVVGSALVRLSGGGSQRINSVSPLGPILGDHTGFIRTCEAIYIRHGLVPLFRLSSAVESGLAPALDAAGYAPPEGETRVLYRTLEPADGPPDVALIRDRPDAAWLDALAHIQGLDAEHRDLRRRAFDALAVPAAFIGATVEDTIGAVAMGAVHDGVLCISAVATDPAFRRRGLAGRAIRSVMAWAAAEAGANLACLPVLAANAPAIELYGGLGFDREALRYGYRRRPAG